MQALSIGYKFLLKFFFWILIVGAFFFTLLEVAAIVEKCHVRSAKLLTTDRPLSKKCFEKLSEVIPGGVNSPVRAFNDLDMAPIVAESAKGAYVYDVDGNCFIDYCMSWGPLIHGHAHPKIIDACIERLKKGTSFGLTTPIEERLARLITKCMPSCEKVRLVNSGTEATMTAVRLARGYTNRSLVIKFAGCYHGHADHFLLQAGSSVSKLKESSSSGIPQDMLKSTICLPYNDLESFSTLLDNPEIQQNLACVILEPIAANMGLVPASREFLQLLRTRTKACGALLIFDEVISGFRVALGGAAELYGIKPDISCFGKIMGGGFPAAGFGASSEIMDVLAPIGGVYQAGTLSGNPVAMEAGVQALELCQEPGFYDRLEKLARIIIDPIKAFVREREMPFCIQSEGSLFTIFCGVNEVKCHDDVKRQDSQLFKKLFLHMFNNGVYMPQSPYEAWFVSTAHSEKDLEYTRDLLLEFFAHIAPKNLCHLAVL